MQSVILGSVVREGLFDEVNFEKRSERRGVSHEDNWLKRFQGGGNSQRKCLAVSTGLVYLRSSKELSVSGGERTREGKQTARSQRANQMGWAKTLAFTVTAGFLEENLSYILKGPFWLLCGK